MAVAQELGVKPVDVYHWRVHYAGGGAIPFDEYEDDQARGWAMVPMDGIVALELVPQADGLRPVGLAIPPGATPTLFRLRRPRLVMETGETTFDPSVACLAWERDDRRIFVWVRDDGLVSVTDYDLRGES